MGDRERTEGVGTVVVGAVCVGAGLTDVGQVPVIGTGLSHVDVAVLT